MSSDSVLDFCEIMFEKTLKSCQWSILIGCLYREASSPPVGVRLWCSCRMGYVEQGTNESPAHYWIRSSILIPIASKQCSVSWSSKGNKNIPPWKNTWNAIRWAHAHNSPLDTEVSFNKISKTAFTLETYSNNNQWRRQKFEI